MPPSDKPRLLAFSRSMVTANCGSFAVNWVNSPASPGVWLRLGNQLLGGAGKIGNRAAALVQQFIGEAAELAQALDRRRQDRQDHRAGDLAERPEQPALNRLRRVLLADPLVERLQAGEDHALVRRRTRESESADREHVLHFRRRLQGAVDLAQHAGRVFQRRGRRRLHDHDEVALVVFRDEAGRHQIEDPVGGAEQREEHDHDDKPDADQAAQHRHDQRRAAVDDPIASR